MTEPLALPANQCRNCAQLAFTVLVFAEMLRAFGARNESKLVWRIPLFGNHNLVMVVAVSIAVQLWSQHSALLGGFLRITPIPLCDGLLLLALGMIPLLVMETAKVIRARRAT